MSFLYNNIPLNHDASIVGHFTCNAGGGFASLWTPETSFNTALVLEGGYSARNISWVMRDEFKASMIIDFGRAFRLEWHNIGKGATRKPRLHIDALGGKIRHWPWGK